MNYKDFNINLDSYLEEKIKKISEEMKDDLHQISIELYYQGFNDAISLLTKSFK